MVQVSVSDFNEWKIVLIQGRMDADHWRRAWASLESLMNPNFEKIALDLSQVEFMGFQCLQHLIEIGLLIKAAGGELVLVGPVAQVRKHLDSFVGHKSLKIFRNLEELQGGMIFTPRSEFYGAEAPALRPLI